MVYECNQVNDSTRLSTMTQSSLEGNSVFLSSKKIPNLDHPFYFPEEWEIIQYFTNINRQKIGAIT